MHIAWFKRDLRIWDNESFTNACKSKNVMPLYIIEPELWKEDDLSYRQYIFLKELLKNLNKRAKKKRQKIKIKTKTGERRGRKGGKTRVSADH